MLRNIKQGIQSFIKGGSNIQQYQRAIRQCKSMNMEMMNTIYQGKIIQNVNIYKSQIQNQSCRDEIHTARDQ
ncbi:hypothetical protein pb186bvf_001239 [Paramecium bursaria]